MTEKMSDSGGAKNSHHYDPKFSNLKEVILLAVWENMLPDEWGRERFHLGERVNVDEGELASGMGRKYASAENCDEIGGHVGNNKNFSCH
jgi:hypothetical protein